MSALAWPLFINFFNFNFLWAVELPYAMRRYVNICGSLCFIYLGLKCSTGEFLSTFLMNEKMIYNDLFISLYIYIYIYIYVCVCACVCVCVMHAWMHIFLCMFACVRLRATSSSYLSMDLSQITYIYIYIYIYKISVKIPFVITRPYPYTLRRMVFFITPLYFKMSSSYLPTPPLGQDMTQSNFFKRSLTGLNSEFSFSLTSCLTKAEEPSLPYYLPIAGGRIFRIHTFPKNE